MIRRRHKVSFRLLPKEHALYEPLRVHLCCGTMSELVRRALRELAQRFPLVRPITVSDTRSGVRHAGFPVRAKKVRKPARKKKAEKAGKKAG